MLPVTAGAEPNLFAGAHHQSFENADFRISGRDMYHIPTVSVNITTPPSPSASKRTRIIGNVVVVEEPVLNAASEGNRGQEGRGLWRVARFLRSRSGRKGPNHREASQCMPVTTPPAISDPSLSTSTSSSTISEGSDDFTMSSIEDFNERHLDPHDLSNAEVYVRCLSSSKGLACWQPKPLRRFSGPDGIVPGDVGTFSAEDGFRKTFNIWDDLSLIRQSGKTAIDRAFLPPENDIACHEDKLQEGETVMEGAVSETTTSVSNGQRRTSSFEFRCRSPQGAVLALTSSADLLEAVHQTELRDTIIRHAELLYRHAESVRRIGHDESLYIVTSCFKTDSWALAAYKDPMGAPGDVLRLMQIGWDDHPEHPNPLYAWTKRGTSEAKCGESAGGRRVKDQTLFLRGFKLAFSQSFRVRMRNEGLSNSRFPDPGHKRELGHDSGGGSESSGGHNGNTSESSSYGSFAGGGGNAPGRAYEAVEGVRIEAFPENRSEVYHPCDSINRLLLDRTGGDFALSHDDDWRFHARKHSCWNGFIRDILRDILRTHTVTVRRGVAFVDTEVHTLERNWEFLSSVFIDLSSPLVQRAPSTWYCDVEGLYFSIPSTWCPAPMPTGPHLLATFGPLRDGEESVSVSFHRFLAFDLAIKNVRSVNGRTLLSYGTEDMVDAVQRIMNFSTGLQLFGASLFDCPADPTLVVLGAMWHRLRIWDALLEHLTTLLLVVEKFFKSGTLRRVALSTQSMFIGALESIDELHEQFTELLEDLIDDLPFSQEDSSTDRSSEGSGAQRSLFLNGECGSLRSEVGRLQSVLCWQGKMLVTLDGIRAGQATNTTLPRRASSSQYVSNLRQLASGIGHKQLHITPQDRVRQWLNSAEFDGPLATSALPLPRHDALRHPRIIELQQKAKSNVVLHPTGHNSTLEGLLRLVVGCRKMATLYLAQGDLETAFIQLTEAHAWVSRLAPRHPDHQTRLKEEERRSLAFHGKDMIWELQDLCVKIAQGLELPSTVSYDSADPELGTLIAGVSQEEVIALLSSPFDQAPVTDPTCHRKSFEARISALRGAWCTQLPEPNSCLLLNEAVRRLFGAAAELDFSITRHESGQTVVGQEYLSRALVKRPGVSGWAPREVAIGRGQTPMVAVENAAREGYEVLRCLYFEWLD